MAQFKSGHMDILVATNIAIKGLDVDAVKETSGSAPAKAALEIITSKKIYS